MAKSHGLDKVYIMRTNVMVKKLKTIWSEDNKLMDATRGSNTAAKVIQKIFGVTVLFKMRTQALLKFLSFILTI